MPMTVELFTNPKPVYVLVLIRRSREELYGSKVCRKIDTTYAHTVNIVNALEKEGYIESYKVGRRRVLELTRKGEVVADLLGEFLDKVEGYNHFRNPH